MHFSSHLLAMAMPVQTVFTTDKCSGEGIIWLHASLRQLRLKGWAPYPYVSTTFLSILWVPVLKEVFGLSCHIVNNVLNSYFSRCMQFHFMLSKYLSFCSKRTFQTATMCWAHLTPNVQFSVVIQNQLVMNTFAITFSMASSNCPIQILV